MDNPASRRIFAVMTHHTDILIVGGGLNGAALALALSQTGLTSVLLDAAPRVAMTTPGFDGRSYALALSSVRLLRNLGLWSRLARDAQPIREIRVSDGRAGEGPLSPFFLQFDSAAIDESAADGAMGQMVEDRHLRAALMEAVAADPRINARFDAVVAAQSGDAHSAQVTLTDGHVITARLLVGADGRRSGTADRAGIKRTGWDYGQTAMVCAIGHDRAHNGIAHQFFMPPGPLAILPLTGNRSSIVWSETHANAAAFNALPEDAYLAMLRPRFGDFLGEIRLAGARYTYPLTLTLANSFVAARLALVGDAAHGIHPIAGQGLNAGLRDVAALADVLEQARARGEDIGAADVLARYQQWRRFETTALAVTTDLTNRLFSNDNPLLRAVRDIGMGVVNATGPLKRALQREAAGVRGDLPRLMRG